MQVEGSALLCVGGLALAMLQAGGRYTRQVAWGCSITLSRLLGCGLGMYLGCLPARLVLVAVRLADVLTWCGWWAGGRVVQGGAQCFFVSCVCMCV